MNTTFLNESQVKITDVLKILIYKTNPYLIETLDLKDNNIFLNPFLFIFFNIHNQPLKSKEILKGILKKSIEKHQDNSSIETLRESSELLNSLFKKVSNNIINDTNFTLDKPLYEKNILFLTNAFEYIKTTSPEHYRLIEKCCKKCVIFKTDPKNTNSFATINAHGLAFFNAYQDDYDEVFFVDDIAHQTGHIILTTYCFDRKSVFKIDENQKIENLINKKDYRDVYTLFHALYTYYSTCLCIDNCLSHKKTFNKRQIYEAKGRLGFYLIKYRLDLDSFKKITNNYNGLDNVLTNKGKIVFKVIVDMFIKIYNKYTKEFSYSNQPYNFTYKKFIKLNPIS